MKVLVACEYSGRVRDAFIAKGHFAISCDLLPTESPGPHYQGDVFDLIYPAKGKRIDFDNGYGGFGALFPGDGCNPFGFDLLIAHPPCTFLTLAGARWFYDPSDKSKPHPDYPNRWEDRDKAIEFFLKLKNAPIKKKCIENSQPLGYVVDRVGKYTQKVQPWMFGEPYTKGACLWLDGLPELIATHEKPENIIAACHHASPGPERWKERSTTYRSIANAMAEQWG